MAQPLISGPARIPLALGLGLAITASCRPPAAEAPIRIGVLCPLTGQIARDAELNLAGAERAVTQVNQAHVLHIADCRAQCLLRQC